MISRMNSTFRGECSSAETLLRVSNDRSSWFFSPVFLWLLRKSSSVFANPSLFARKPSSQCFSVFYATNITDVLFIISHVCLMNDSLVGQTDETLAYHGIRECDDILNESECTDDGLGSVNFFRRGVCLNALFAIVKTVQYFLWFADGWCALSTGKRRLKPAVKVTENDIFERGQVLGHRAVHWHRWYH